MVNSFRLACCNELFEGKSLTQVAHFLRGCGYHGIEIAPYTIATDIRTLAENERRQIRQAIAQEEMAICAFHWLLASPKGLHICSPRPETQAETKKFFRAVIDLAQDWRTGILVFGSPAQRSIDPLWNYDESLLRGIDFLRDMGDYASKYGLTIAFEPLGPAITNFGGSLQDSLEILNQINHKNIKLTLDFAAMSRDPLSLQQQLEMIPLEKIAHVHANDPNQLGPGMGEFDPAPILGYLQKNSYEGWISVEAFSNAVPPDEIARKSLNALKKSTVSFF